MRASYLIALAIAVGLAGWMASGQPAVRALFAGAVETVTEAPAVAEVDRRPRVRVMTSEAQPMAPELVLHGRTEPHRDVTLRAETFGRVAEILVAKGATVRTGDPVLRLDPREREATLDQARAVLRQRELEYEAARRLGSRGFQADNAVAAALAQLEGARAEVRAREVNLDHTTVRAPFDGLLDDRMVEVGDFVDTGDPLAHVVELDPLLVTGEVAETQKARVGVGTVVEVDLADGSRHEGELRFVAQRSDAATRTYRIEAVVPNPERAAPAGMSATLRLRFPVRPAHRLSSALLALDEHHVLGIKAVEAGVVRFLPVEIVRADADAVWLTGLPERIDVIVVGQGFVRDGDAVNAVAVPAATGDLAGLGR